MTYSVLEDINRARPAFGTLAVCITQVTTGSCAPAKTRHWTYVAASWDTWLLIPSLLEQPDLIRTRSRFIEKLTILADKLFVSQFLKKAEEILEVATTGGNTMTDTVILLDRQGGFRMMDPTGWSLTGLAAEYGAAAVYKIERRGEAVRVEGWDGSDRCLLQRTENRGKLRTLLPCTPYRVVESQQYSLLNSTT